MAPSKFIKFNYKIFHYDTIITIISLITTTWYCYHYDTIISIIYIIHINTFIHTLMFLMYVSVVLQQLFPMILDHTVLMKTIHLAH